MLLYTMKEHSTWELETHIYMLTCLEIYHLEKIQRLEK